MARSPTDGIFRPLAGYTRTLRVHMRKQLKTDVTEGIEKYRIKWRTRVEIMKDDIICKNALLHIPQGRRKVRCPTDDASEVL